MAQVLNVLEELNIDYTRINFVSPPPEWYSGITATGLSLIPSMRDGAGLVISDSNSIGIHLACKHGGQPGGLWPLESAQVGQGLMWAGETINACSIHGLIDKHACTMTRLVLPAQSLETYPLRTTTVCCQMTNRLRGKLLGDTTI